MPIIITFMYSLKDYKLTEPWNEKFVGLANYIHLFKDPTFQTTLANSAIILGIFVICGVMLSIMLALVLHKNTKITPLLTALTIIPWALPPLVNGIIWKFIFFPGYGLVNTLLLDLGIITAPVAWTSNRFTLLIIISIVVIWRSVPFGAIVILANLEQIPEELYEAIYMDGATPLQAFRKITLPLIAPSLAIVVINFIYTGLNVFDEVIALSGYTFQGQTLAVYTYMTTFNFLDFGLGSAVSYITMLTAGLIGYAYIRHLHVEKLY
jgi:multiple sugar transport system permease protein